MNQSLTVILPLHNAEATLRMSVDRVLEVTSELTADVKLLIMDDGSTDDTYDIARELAIEYPQVRVIRQSQQRGLGPTIRNARRRVSTDVVMVHDGVSEINAEQLQALWDRRLDAGQPSDVSASDLLRPKQNHAAMAAAHRRLMGFQMLPAGKADEADEPIPPRRMSPNQAPHRTPTSNHVGAIPTLPRPNFMGAISDFARGE